MKPNAFHLAAICAATFSCASHMAQAEFQIVAYKTEDGATIEAALFTGGTERAVLFAHGAVFNKESWYPIAEELQSQGVTALSIDFRGYGNSAGGDVNARHLDIQAGVAYLQSLKMEHVALVGGSMGAMAILAALNGAPVMIVDRAVLLAPSTAPAIKSDSIDKLFIVSEGDRAAAPTRKVFEDSAEPKRLEILAGDAHAQHIFATPDGPKLTKLMVDFVSK